MMKFKYKAGFCKYCKLWEFAGYRDSDILPVLGKNSCVLLHYSFIGNHNQSFYFLLKQIFSRDVLSVCFWIMSLIVADYHGP